MRNAELSKAQSPYINHVKRKRFHAPWPSWYQPPIMPQGRLRATNATDLIRLACEIIGGITPAEFRSKSKVQSLIWARHAVVYVLHRYRRDMSYPQIASAVGRKCHSTIINSCKKATALRQVNADFAALVAKLEGHANGTR